MLLERLFELTRGRRAPRLHARGARLERDRHRALRAARFRVARHPPRLLHGQPRGRADHVEGPGRARRRRDPRHRDVLRRDRRGGRHRRRRDPRRTSSPRRPTSTRATAASSPRSRRDATSSWSRRSSARRSPRRRRTLDDDRPRRRHARPGPDRRAPRRPRRREGDRLGAAAPARARRPPRRARRLALPPAESLEPPFLCLLASGGHTLLLDVASHARPARRSARRSTTRPARPSTRARACSGSGIPAGASSTGSRATATRTRTTSRSRASRARLLVLGSEDGAALRDARRSRRRSSRRGARISPRPTSARSSRALVGRVRAAAEQLGAAGSRSWAASRRTRELRAALPDAALAPLPLCTDNAAMIASAARVRGARPVPGLSWARCVRLALSRGAPCCSRVADRRGDGGALAVGGRRGARRRARRRRPRWHGLVGAPRRASRSASA